MKARGGLCLREVIRGGLCLREVIRVEAGGKCCGSGLHQPRYYAVAVQHSHVAMVVSWEVAAHVKCDRALAALRLDKAHSRYLTTLLRSDWDHIMFAGTCSYQCAPTSSKSWALAKPFKPAQGPPFNWLYSSSSTAKFQSCAAMVASTLEWRCLSGRFLVGGYGDPSTAVSPSSDKRTRGGIEGLKRQQMQARTEACHMLAPQIRSALPETLMM